MLKNRLYVCPSSSPDLNGTVEPHNQKPSKPAKVTERAIKKSKKNDVVIEPCSCKNSDDSFEQNNFEYNHPRLMYTREEDEWIAKMILQNDNIFKVSSLSLWRRLETKKSRPKRTYQSMKNRFLRNIKPYIFTTFQHLVKDEATKEKILQKFPELKKSSDTQRTTLEMINLGQRAGTSSSLSKTVENPKTKVNGVLNDNELKTPVHEPLEKRKRLDSELAFGESFRHERSVRLRDDSISVSVKFVKVPEETSARCGIYETFDRLRKNNVLILCPHCGRGGPALGNSDSDSDDEGRLFIVSSELPESQDLMEPEPRKKDRSPVPSTSAQVLPSPSFCSSSQVNMDTGSSKSSSNSQSSQNSKKISNLKRNKNNKKASQSPLKISHKDLDLLYRETLAHCRIFMDSYEDEEDHKMSSSMGTYTNKINLQQTVLLEKKNVECFFLESESGDSGS